MAVCVAGGAGLPGKRKCSDGLPVLSFVLLLAVALAGMATPSAAAVYKVGDSVGWTIIGTPNYTSWAASKKFSVGDTLLFVYNNTFHNVEEVSVTDFKSCNAKSAMATYTSGNDSFTLKTVGHRFFLCGIPGHCGLGQKVDINVLKKASPASPGPSPATSPGSSPSVPTGTSPAAGGPTATPSEGGAPPPANSRAAPGSSVSYAVGWAAALLAVAIGANLN